MPIDWSLQRANAGLFQSFTNWGIRSGVRVSINQGVGTLTLGFGATDLLAASPFDPDEELLILRQGLPWFRGRITGEKRGAYGSSEGLPVILSDPWWYLEKIIYTQVADFVDSTAANPVPANPAGLQLSDFTLVTKRTSDIIVSEDQSGTLVDSKAQVIDALNYAIGKGAPIAIGTIDAGIAIPRDELKDATCAEIILKSLRWTPDMTAWWDYSVTPPKLNIRSRANRPLYNIDIANQIVAAVELNQRRDLALSGVTINYIRRNQRSNFEFVTLDTDTAGPTPDGIGALLFTQELYGSYLVQTAAGPPPVSLLVAAEPIPAGLALQLYNTWGVAPWEGRINLVADDLADVLWLSQTASVLNGNPAWALATMDIQQSSEDVFSGRTELTVGPPRQLGPTDLIGLVRKGRTVQPPAGANTGGYPKSDPLPPGSPDPRIQFGPPNQPDVILRAHGQHGTPSGLPVATTYDTVNIYDAQGGTLQFTGNLNNQPLIISIPNVGDTTNQYGVIIGHGSPTDQVDPDPPPFGSYPPPPVPQTFNVYLDQPRH